MKQNKAVPLFFIVLLPAIILLSGCGSQYADSTEALQGGSGQGASEEIDWGREVGLDAMIAMAQTGQIQEIQWHVMPNILRAQGADGDVYHLRNENKGVDLRNALMEAGVRIGKDGVLFRHVF